MMLSKLSKNISIKRILVVSLTNVGDIVLTCPVIDVLCSDFPRAQIDVLVGPKGISLFENNPYVQAEIFDKQDTLKEKKDFILDLRRRNYDLVVDLRQTMLPLFVRPLRSTSIFVKKFGGHLKDKHLARLKSVYAFQRLPTKKYGVFNIEEDQKFFDHEVSPWVKGQPFVVLSPGAADSAKRWHWEGFADVADILAERYKIVIVGGEGELKMIQNIQERMKSPSLSLACKINLRGLGYILKQSAFAITHDSGVMHLASYFNIPVVALYGPTDPDKSHPWGNRWTVVRKNEGCERCQNPKSLALHNCMSFIKVNDVIGAVATLS